MTSNKRNYLKKTLKKILNIFLNTLFSIDMSEKNNRSWYKKNFGNIIGSFIIIFTCTMLASLNSIKAQEKLIIKKRNIIQELLIKDHQIYTKKFKQNIKLNQKYNSQLNSLSLTKKALDENNIFNATKEWRSILSYYLENKKLNTLNSKYVNNDISRKFKKLNSAILRYNKETLLLNKWLNKFPNKQLKNLTKIKTHKLFDIKIDPNQYNIYE
tara:strand:+ start:1306 stop:1944 length:639 start_codon:yes stop_codon:yes gene_type:complete